MTPAIEPIALLRTLGQHYRHVEHEHASQPPRSATRHRIEAEMHGLKEHFERLLAEWVIDDDLRARWREFLRGRQAAPAVPPLPPAPIFKGRTDGGGLLEIRPVADGFDVFVDGARVDHGPVPWNLEPDLRGPIAIGEHICEEVFDAPEPALRALEAFRSDPAVLPWRWARELIEDGLIDTELALTPRGRRCLSHAPIDQPVHARNRCVIVADAARARVLMLDPDRDGQTELVELIELSNPMLRVRESDVLADSGGGRRGGGKAPLHGTPDRRDHRRRDVERHFAARIAEEAASIWRRYPACELIVAASPGMLGLLRPAIDKQIRVKDRVEVQELARDLTKLTNPALHDQLAAAELIPARGRRPSPIKTPGLPA